MNHLLLSASTSSSTLEIDFDTFFASGAGVREDGGSSLQAGTLVGGSYLIVGELGEGAMGRVYEVEHTRTARRLAMKMISGALVDDPDIRRRFAREATVISRLESKHTVQIVDSGTSNGSAFIVMELVRGETLGARLRNERRLDERHALSIALQICRSLAEAHDKGIIHRDVKPENVMLTTCDGAEHVKVLDFGLAKMLTPAPDDVVSSAGTVMGTPHYMSPEQILGASVDARADVYALGGVLYRALTGERPFAGKLSEVISQHLTATPVRPELRAPDAKISPATAAIVMRCLEKEPRDRFEGVRALAEALDEALADIERRGVDTVRAPAPARRAPPGELDASTLVHYEQALSRGARRRARVAYALAAIAAVTIAMAAGAAQFLR